jgi:hypothetical protein
MTDGREPVQDMSGEIGTEPLGSPCVVNVGRIVRASRT